MKQPQIKTTIMKNLFVPFTLIILAGAMFSSCSNTSKLSITKRHYRSGYYVNWGSKKQTLAVTKIPATTRHQVTPEVIAKSENTVASKPSIVASLKSVIIQKLAPSKKIQISENRTVNSTSSGKNIFSTNANATNNVTESQSVNNKQAIYDANDGDGGSSERAALSLLWIVIVVILILWLIGILAGGWGLGGLINLLLVIALILLILWLLRIW